VFGLYSALVLIGGEVYPSPDLHLCTIYLSNCHSSRYCLWLVRERMFRLFETSAIGKKLAWPWSLRRSGETPREDVGHSLPELYRKRGGKILIWIRR
jgi:hypothetical protein